MKTTIQSLYQFFSWDSDASDVWFTEEEEAVAYFEAHKDEHSPGSARLWYFDYPDREAYDNDQPSDEGVLLTSEVWYGDEAKRNTNRSLQ